MADRAADQERCDHAKVLRKAGVAPTAGGVDCRPDAWGRRLARFCAAARRKPAGGRTATAAAAAYTAIPGTESTPAGTECGNAATESGVRPGSREPTDPGGIGRVPTSV